MVSFEKFQQEKNEKYYAASGTDFLKDVKTFAADKYFVTAMGITKKPLNRGAFLLYISQPLFPPTHQPFHQLHHFNNQQRRKGYKHRYPEIRP